MVSPTNPDLSRLLSFEDSPELLEVRCQVSGVPLWAVMRQRVLRHFLYEWLYGSSSRQPSGLGARLKSVVARARRTSEALLRNAYLRPARSDLLFVCTGAGLLMTPERLVFNRYTDYFAGAATVPVWSVEGWTGSGPAGRRAQPRCSSSVPAKLRWHVGRRVRAPHIARSAAAFVDHLVERSTTQLDQVIAPEVRAGWKRTATRLLLELPAQTRFWTSVLERVQPKLAIVEEGCYSEMAAFNAAAHARGIRVTEFQHGAVSAGHDAYNFAPALRESSVYRTTLPDDFLAYGRWWAEQFNAPLRKVVIGNPHREALVAACRARQGRDRVVLVLGDGLQTASYLEFSAVLAQQLPSGWKTVFRPHPLERRAFLDSSGPKLPAGVELDVAPDIYDSLRAAEAVVSEVSTGLFEAIGVTPRVFLWDTDKARFAYPSHPFSPIASAAALARVLGSQDGGLVSADVEAAVWATEWEPRFREYLRAEGVSQ